MESGPGPPANALPDLQTPHSSEPSELPHNTHAPQLPSLPLFPSLPPYPSLPPSPSLAPLPRALQLPPVPQAVKTVEVIDLTGLSDEDKSDDWEDVPDIIDLTNLLSSDEDEDEDEDHDDVPQNYTILNLPPRRYAKIRAPPVLLSGQTPRAARRAAARAARAADRRAGRVPVRRAVCELCARVVRWGPGVLITKHHLYPQEITKKYPEKYTLEQKKSIALLCRPCHDACHKVGSNRMLADFYYEVDLLKADPGVQAHVRSMQRATTPELIQRYGDGVTVRQRKELVRAARSEPQKKLALQQWKAHSRLRQRKPAPLPPPPPPPPPGVRRSARLLAKTTGDQSQAPIIVIEDEDEDMQDLVFHEEPKGNNNEKMQDAVSEEELAALESLGEYIRL